MLCKLYLNKSALKKHKKQNQKPQKGPGPYKGQEPLEDSGGSVGTLSGQDETWVHVSRLVQQLEGTVCRWDVWLSSCQGNALSSFSFFLSH